MQMRQDAEEFKRKREHQEVLVALRTIMGTASGQFFIRYLFKHFGVGEFPAQGLDGAYLHDQLGLFRAGQSIFAIASEANPGIAGNLLAQKEKERNEAAFVQSIEEREAQ